MMKHGKMDSFFCFLSAFAKNAHPDVNPGGIVNCEQGRYCTAVISLPHVILHRHSRRVDCNWMAL